MCWSIDSVDPDHLNPALLDFSPEGRVEMKSRYRGDLFPAEIPEGASGKLFVEFFQTHKETGAAKGIIALQIGGEL